MTLLIEAIAEDLPGEKWRRIFDRHWPAYRRWFLQNGISKPATYLQSLKALRTYMPELVPTYERICELAGGGDLEARFLSMWCPPAYVGGCSQAIYLEQDTIALIRNYDYSPKLLEGTLIASRFLGRRVVAMSDCLWGVLDGINESGLAVSLSFGGRPDVGEGFGIPLVLRYVLEVCSDVTSAVSVLSGLPVHMGYSIALVDRRGNHAIVFLTPNNLVEVVDARVVTNHQHKPSWKRYAAATRSVERERALKKALKNATDLNSLTEAFLRDPVYQQAYEAGYGTLYTSLYRPDEASIELIWPNQRWKQSCAAFQENKYLITFTEAPNPVSSRMA